MKPRHTITLWAIFLALCVAYWWTLRSEQEALRVRDEARTVFAGRTAADLARVSIARLGESTVTGERTADGWTITAPHAIEASPQVWSRIAESLIALRAIQTLDGVEDLELFGLDTPRMRVEVEWSDGETQTLAYGLMEPTGRYRYVHSGDGAYFLATNDAFAELDRPLSDLRNRYILGSGREQVSRVAYTRIREPREDEEPAQDMPPELEGGVWQMSVVFELDDENRWQQVQPIEGFANQGMVDDFVTHIQFATGRNYNDTPAPLQNYGMGPAPARLEVWFGDDEEASQILYLGGPADERGDTIYAKRADKDAVFAVEASTLGYFPDTPNAFLEHRLLTHGTMNVHRIRYRHGDDAIVMEDQGDAGWKIVAPEPDALDSVSFTNFVAFLAHLEGTGFPEGDPAQYGLDDPIVSIQLEYEGEGAPSDTRPILLGRADATGEFHYAQSDRGTIVSISAGQAASLKLDRFHFQDKTLMRFLPASVRAVDLTFEGQRYEFANVDGLWIVRAPEGLRWESQADMRMILTSLSRVRAAAVELEDEPTEQDLERFELAYPVLSATVEVLEDDRRVAVGPVEVGGVAPPPSQSRYIRSPMRQGVFHVDQGIVDDIREALRGIVRAE